MGVWGFDFLDASGGAWLAPFAVAVVLPEGTSSGVLSVDGSALFDEGPWLAFGVRNILCIIVLRMPGAGLTGAGAGAVGGFILW